MPKAKVGANIFCGRSDVPDLPERAVPSKKIYHTKHADALVRHGEDEFDFNVQEKVIVYEELSRRKELNKFRDDVGCENIINKLARQGIDAGDGRFKAQPGYQDATALPQNMEEMIALSKEINPKTSKIWAGLPEEMKKGLSLEEFAQKFETSFVDDYIAKKYPQSQAKKEGEE